MTSNMPNGARMTSLLALGGALLALMVAASSASSAEGAADYRIAPQTKLKVTIVEWIKSTGDYKEWTPLNGEYSVSSKGTISIPMIGELEVGGKNITEAEGIIGSALKERTGLSDAPVASVEITRYPLIYVTGAVDRPGQYEFQPALNVLQAVALAGGRERRQIQTSGYSEADQIRNLGELNRYGLQLKQLIARRARLQAEVAGLKEVNTPDAVSSAGDKDIMDAERALFTAETKALQQHLDALADLKVQLQNELDVLDRKRQVQERQVKIAEDDLSAISGLVNSQTLSKTRQSSSERILADLRSGSLDLEVQSMRAKQQLSETERDAVTLKGKFFTDAQSNLQVVESEIGDTKIKRGTLLQILQITGASLAKVDDMRAIKLQALEFWIRRKEGGSVETRVEETSILQPGDLLDVRLSVTGDALERTALLQNQQN